MHYDEVTRIKLVIRGYWICIHCHGALNAKIMTVRIDDVVEITQLVTNLFLTPKTVPKPFNFALQE